MYYIRYMKKYSNAGTYLEERLSITDAQVRVDVLHSDCNIRDIEIFTTEELLQTLVDKITTLEKIVEQQSDKIDELVQMVIHDS